MKYALFVLLVLAGCASSPTSTKPEELKILKYRTVFYVDTASEDSIKMWGADTFDENGIMISWSMAWAQTLPGMNLFWDSIGANIFSASPEWRKYSGRDTVADTLYTNTIRKIFLDSNLVEIQVEYGGFPQNNYKMFFEYNQYRFPIEENIQWGKNAFFTMDTVTHRPITKFIIENTYWQ